MQVRRLWLEDFRNYERLDLQFAEGLTVVVGRNGQGKTNLVEALAWLSTLSSFRGASNDTLVAVGAERAIIRAELDVDGREQLIEAEIPRSGRTRVQVNKQRMNKTRELLGTLRVTVFAPDDLSLIKDGPSGRRRFVDDLLVSLHPKNDKLRTELDRVLRQRNALLKQARGVLSDEVAVTLEIWDAKLVAAGEQLARGRQAALDRLQPLAEQAYADLADDTRTMELSYVAPWREHGLAQALADARSDELRRGVSLVGPHRDDIAVRLGAFDSRTHASQGEQRSLALAMRLAAHRLIEDHTEATPVLVLDDVFSELDPQRCAALIDHLPAGQAILTTAGAVPDSLHPSRLVTIDQGTASTPAPDPVGG